MATEFSTRAIDYRQRFEYWHDVICRQYCTADSALNNLQNFDASLSVRPLGMVEVGEIDSAAIRYTRSLSNLKSAPNDDFLFSLLLQGEAQLTQDGRQAVQRAGDMVLYDTGRSFNYDFLTGYHLVLLKIPRKQLLSRLSEAERITAMVVSSNTAMGALAAGLVRQSSNLELQQSSNAAAKVGASMMDVLAAALELELADKKGLGHRQTDLLERAKQYILANLEDTTLCLEGISSALAVSSRTLSRLFAAEGTTPIQWLWHQRLQASYHALAEGRGRQVTEIASTCGFSDFSHFSRAFKKQFGVTPSTLLRSH